MIFRCMHIYTRIDLRLFFFERAALSVLCGELGVWRVFTRLFGFILTRDKFYCLECS